MDTSSATRTLDRVVPRPPATGGRFPGADTLRAVGAFAVLTTHVAFWADGYSGRGLLGPVFARLDVGVALFFVLSGFLLGRPWLAAADRTRRPAVRSYLWKRFLRIAPLYVLTVVVALSLIKSNAGLGVRDWVVTLLMLNTFVDPFLPTGLTQMWSLAVEVTFYLVLPLLMLALVGRGALRTRRVLIGLAVMVAVTVFWILYAGPQLSGNVSGLPEQWLPSYLSWFAAGLLLALVQVLHERGVRSRLVRSTVALARLPGCCWTVIVALMLAVSTPIGGPTTLVPPTSGEAMTKSLAYLVIGFLAVLTVVFTDESSRYGRFIGHPFGRRLGYISYGVFCFHLPLLHFIIWATGWKVFYGHGIELWVLAVVSSVLVAEVTYRLVERPLLALKTRPPRLLRGKTADDATTTVTNGTSSR